MMRSVRRQDRAYLCNAKEGGWKEGQTTVEKWKEQKEGRKEGRNEPMGRLLRFYPSEGSTDGKKSFG